MALSSYLLFSTAFFSGASGIPDDVGPLPSNFVQNADGGYVVSLTAGQVFNMTVRDLLPVHPALSFDICIDYTVLSGQVRVSPAVWTINPISPYPNQGGVTADGIGQGPGTYSVKARFAAAGGGTNTVWPDPIAWISGTSKFRPSAAITETGGDAATVRINGFSVDLVSMAQQVTIPSSLDSYQQPAIYSRGDPTKPVIVSLHSWHGTYNGYDSYQPTLDFAIANGWTFISPDFRGAANDPTHQLLHAGSDKAIQDVLDARQWALTDSGADPAKVYIMGGSGGGYMSLLVAGKNPSLFKAVAEYAGITDLAGWHEWCVRRGDQNLDTYSNSVAASLGGVPSAIPDSYAARSPIKWLDGLSGVPVHIQHGVQDGTVPLENALNAFNAVAEAKGLDADEIVGAERRALINHGRVGQTLPAEITGMAQGGYVHPIPFTRKTGDVQIIVEAAGHTGDPQHVFDFLQAVEAGTFN